MPKLNLPISAFLVLQQAVRNSAVQSLAGAVVPIDNLSMVVSIIFSYMIFKKTVCKIKHKYSYNNRRHLFMLLLIKF